MQTFEVIGGATIPGSPGVHSLGASYPLAVLEADAGGVCVRLRWRWMTAFFRFVIRLEGGDPEGAAEWQASWEEIDHALVGPRSIVMFRGSGYPCRFVVWDRRVPRRLEAEFVAHGVEVNQVRSTLSHTLQVLPNRDSAGAESTRRRWCGRLVAFAPVLVGVGGIVLVTQGGRWSGWSLAGFVIAGLGAAASMVGMCGLARRGR